MLTDIKPAVYLGNLDGPEGNTYCILGRCQEAAKHMKWNKKQIQSFMDKATSGDYDNLLEVVYDTFEVLE